MSRKVRMTPSEAFVETMVAHGVNTVFGIVGSAYMDALDLFPLAGIRFFPTAREQNAAHMADGYSRVTNKLGVCVGQKEPGITNFVTAIAAPLLGTFPGGSDPARSGQPERGAGRLSGNRPDADPLEDHEIPGLKQEKPSCYVIYVA